jgi:hypothetical protein
MRRPRAVTAVALALVALALVLAACGGGGGNEPTTDPSPDNGVEVPTETATPRAPGALPPEFVRCMADQGVDIEGPSDLHSPGAQQAFPACIESLHGS